jgi:hypothetical protein
MQTAREHYRVVRRFVRKRAASATGPDMQLHHCPPASLFFDCSSPPFASGVVAGSNFVTFGISRQSIYNDC